MFFELSKSSISSAYTTFVRLDASHEHQGDAAATAELDAGGTIDGVALAAVTRHFVREVVRTLRWETRGLLDPEFLRDELVSIEQGS